MRKRGKQTHRDGEGQSGEVTTPTRSASEGRGGAARSGERWRGQDNGEMGEIRQA